MIVKLNLLNLILNFWFADDKEKCDIVTAETVEKLITEIGNIKTQLNNTELQLYEANEKISELIDTVSNRYKKAKQTICMVYSLFVVTTLTTKNTSCVLWCSVKLSGLKLHVLTQCNGIKWVT